MIQIAYADHGKLLSTVGVTPDPILAHVRSAARDWAEVVLKKYEERIPLAPSKAYFGVKRSEGGCFKVLKSNMTSNMRAKNHALTSELSTRIDPPMLYLHGKPGVGKSFLTNLLSKRISKRFGKVSDVYFRNFEQDHWDGYHGQLITQFDDAFQSVDTRVKPDKLISELIVMKSNCLYQVPMAKLEEKGRQFTSEFILMSGNMPLNVIGQNVQSITCPDALIRRFDFLVEILENDFRSHRIRAQIQTFKGLTPELDSRFRIDSCFTQEYFDGSTSDFLTKLEELMISKHKIAFESALRSKDIHDDARLQASRRWTIPVLTDRLDQPSFGYSFPYCPDVENVVEAFAIAEPLKVRMITKSQPIAWALKPLQKAMWSALGEFPCFGLTQGQSIDEMLHLIKDQKGGLLSGDYSSATDRLNSDVMATVVAELLRVFKHHESLCHYLRWESGVHRITYPSWTGVPDVLQTRGQLMGSLLSFPILCVANAATVMCLRKQELHEVRALINGDDILFREPHLRKVNSWKRIATAMGLEPSVGKNYYSEKFGSINSQLIEVMGPNRLEVRKTGKFTVCGAPSYHSISMASVFEFPKPLIVKWGKSVLNKTPQSIDLGVNFGGLGAPTEVPSDSTNTRENRTVYAFFASKSLHKAPAFPIGEGKVAVRMPHLLSKRLCGLTLLDKDCLNRARLLNQAQEDSLLRPRPEEKEFPWREYHSFVKRSRDNPALRKFIRSGDLSRVPPLNLLRPVIQIILATDYQMIDSARTHLLRNLV
jgi:hypothetical protein